MGRADRHLAEAGARAPEFRLPRLDGGYAGLAEIFAQGPALLAFFKISCPVCQLAFPFLERIHQAGAQAGAPQVYGISQNDAKGTRDFAKRYGTTFPMLLDSEESGFPVSNAYGISSVPTMFLIERDGSIGQVIVGWRKQEMAALGAVREDDRVPEWKAG
jgi:peroxiredoxin